MSDVDVFQLILWMPSILSAFALAISCLREPRQFRNALFLLVFVLWTGLMLLMRYGQEWMVVPLALLIVLFPFVSVVALLANGVVVVRRNGLSAASLLPVALAVFLVVMFVALPLAFMLAAPAWVTSLIGLFVLEGVWFSFSLVALLLYSWLYRMLPRRRTYGFIVIHGAGLDGTKPTPLLAGRIDKAIELWERKGRRGRLVASGGQGADEEISEADAMHRYLVSRGVPEDAIIDEDRSTTTWENLRFSREKMDDAWQKSADVALENPEGGIRPHSADEPYRVAVVTSDYHVFRCAEYAHKLGIKADGIGSHTRGWYWPAAFIREFVAVTKAHLWPYVVIFVLWALPLALRLVRLAVLGR